MIRLHKPYNAFARLLTLSLIAGMCLSVFSPAHAQFSRDNSPFSQYTPPANCAITGLSLCNPVHRGNLNALMRQNWVRAFMMMTEQMTTVAMHQVAIIGQFFDAKHQLESQRQFQIGYAKAHRAYHPSEQVCIVGTAVQSLALSEQESKANAHALNQHMQMRQRLNANRFSALGYAYDHEFRLDQYLNRYCNDADNNGGIQAICEATDTRRSNADINFAHTIWGRDTLEANFTDAAATDHEIDTFALSNYLYDHEVFSEIPHMKLSNEEGQEVYLEKRKVFALQSVAQNTFAHLVADRTEAAEDNAPFLKAVMSKLGVSDEAEINALVGNRPSYYSQMNLLTKAVYQSPSFYSNLYDKPENVQRIKVAAQAQKLMHDRDLYEIMLRREMLLSIIAEVRLRRIQEKADLALITSDSSKAQAE